MRARNAAVVRTLTALAMVTGTLGGVLVTDLAGSSADAVSTNQIYQVPAKKRLTVKGRGFGHGRGMSQYGAQGAALQGRTYQQIVDFYYPGTSWSKFAGKVRVLISSDTTSDVVVSPTAGLRLRDLGNDEIYELPRIEGVKRWRINTDGARSVVGYLTNRWRRWTPGGREALVGDGQFAAAGPLTLWTPSGPRAYRGRLRAASPTPGSSVRDTVNVLRMDGYVKGVIPYEMPASWKPAAVRAQAVAARTYATWSRAQYSDRYYQICDTTSCQVYGGVDGEDYRSNAAVNATRGEILTHGGEPAFTQFSASNGGWTRAGSVPYLTAKKDPYDGFDGNPVHSWSTSVDVGRLESAYGLGTLKRIRVTSRDGNGDWRGWVNTLVLDGTNRDVTISGDTFRSFYGLRSAWFTFG